MSNPQTPPLPYGSAVVDGHLPSSICGCPPDTHGVHHVAPAQHLHCVHGTVSCHAPARARANLVAVPLVKRWPAMVECPACKDVGPTTTRYQVGNATHGFAVLFFFTTGIGFFIPYVMNHFKDVQHSCMRCGRRLATCHYGTGTEAHLM